LSTHSSRYYSKYSTGVDQYFKWMSSCDKYRACRPCLRLCKRWLLVYMGPADRSSIDLWGVYRFLQAVRERVDILYQKSTLVRASARHRGDQSRNTSLLCLQTSPFQPQASFNSAPMPPLRFQAYKPQQKHLRDPIGRRMENDA
jgi:hypothetical protein